MKKIIKLFLFIVVGLVIAQTQVIYSTPDNLDSLKMKVRSLQDDTLKVLELAKLSKRYSKNQADSSLTLGLEALDLSRKLGYQYGEAYSSFILGISYKYLGDYNKSIEYAENAYNIFNHIKNEPYKARVLNSLGNLYKRKGDFEKAIVNFTISMDISKRIKDSIMLSALYNNIAVLYYELGNRHEQSLEYHKLNLELLKKVGDKGNIFNCYMNLGNVYKDMNDNEKALDYYRQSLDYLEENNLYDKLLLVHNLGTVYEKLKKYELALRYYNDAIELEKIMGNKGMLVYSLQGVGNVLLSQGSFVEGEKYLLKSYTLAKEIGDLTKQKRLVNNLKKVYEKQGNYKESLKYLEIYDDIEDSIYNINYIKQVTLLEQKYETEKKLQQIAFLEKENEIHKLEIKNKEIENKQKSFQRNVLIIAVFVTILLTFYFALNSKKRKKINMLLIKQNKKIIDQREEIGKQNEELLDSNKTKDKLFQIIAHDLRSPLVSMDSITQLIPYWIEEQDYESLKKLSQTLELSVNNVLSLIDNLLNWALNQQGKFPYQPENLKLKENIIETIEVYKPIAEIKNIDLKFTFTKDVRVFADKDMLFTVMRNLLNNAIKFTPEHGQITVGIDSNVQFAKVWVKDSGVGIPKGRKEEVFELANGIHKGTSGETGKGLGLFFCKEFVTMNNGDIFIESQEGRGTTITFTLPLFNLAEN